MLQIITGLQILIRANHTTSKVVMAPWLNWIEQPPPKGQVTGSSPVGVTKFPFFTQPKRYKCVRVLW